MPNAATNPLSMRQKLKDFDFSGLFIEELGWDHHRAPPLLAEVNGSTFTLKSVAEKRGMVAYVCGTDAAGAIPDYPTRRKIERQVAKSAHEHIIVYVDAASTTQTWQWVKRELGKPTACREHTFHKSQSGEALAQKLQAIAFDIQEEERLTITEVAGRARQAFDVDRVTKRFYDRFKSEHAAFLDFIKGIASQSDREWYASLMLNRLMFIYFIQKKGFLDSDADYLRHRLQMMREREGKDRFLTFYRHFLLRLFHEGLGGQARNPELDALLGKVPYLNGGLFDQHKLEEENPAIEIPDDAFERLFNFFDAYQWHLDADRPLRADNEINPDVLGYIFEKYVNQKQMGAYYTKEDITEYISKNTVIPFLFDAAAKECAIAFRPESAVWQLLRDDPDRYIYDAVRKGVDMPLPDDIATGIPDVSKRGGWNRPAAAEYALPTETWREHVARRTRCLELRAKLAAGEVHAINDPITCNLNIRQFAQDVIESCEGPELLRAFYHAIEKVSVLDPTCGSGAFLFAALNILEPLYQACLDRMQAFLDDLERSSEPHRPEKYSDFRRTLDQANDTKKHPSHKYFTLKSIVLKNLYGVDIMEEAVEICKLRLFLKLVAQVQTADQIEPLPDIDFNIRAGNTLVGFTSLEAVRHAMTMGASGQSRMLSEEDQAILRHVEEEALVADQAFQMFRDMQGEHGMDASQFTAAKTELRQRLDSLRQQLTGYLAAEYGIEVNDTRTYEKWRSSHQPFHWFVEFYGVMHSGGFDVIIGNPPWVEYYKVSSEYKVRGLSCIECNNLWAFVTERSIHLLYRGGRCGLIVPMSLVCTRRMSSIQDVLRARGTSWISSYESDSNPGQLFDGVKQNVSILLYLSGTQARLYATRLLRFFSDARDFVFSSVQYVALGHQYIDFGFPKASEVMEHAILHRLFSHSPLASQLSVANGSAVYVHRIAHYYIKCFDFVPYFNSDRDGVKKSEDYKEYLFRRPIEPFVSIINSSTFYLYWQVFYDSFKAGKECVERFPCSKFIDTSLRDGMSKLCHELMEDMRRNSRRLRARYSATGKVEYDQFYPRLSKALIDEIDRVLAQHYGFTDEELDFIINYDIKYRMGQDAEAEEDGE